MPEYRDRTDELLEIIKGIDGWMTRGQIATAFGRNGRLNPADIRDLERLVEAGTVEKRQKAVRGFLPIYEYKAV